jgi:hypothetical protein
MSNDQVTQNKLLQGAVGEEQRQIVEGIIGQNQQLQHQLDLLNEEKQLFEQGDNLQKQLQSPWDKLTADLAEYDDLFHKHAIDQTTYGRAVQQAYRQAAQAMGETKVGDLIAKGSKEEILTLQRGRYGSQGESLESRMQRIAENAYQEERQQTTIQQQMLNAIQNMQPLELGVI